MKTKNIHRCECATRHPIDSTDYGLLCIVCNGWVLVSTGELTRYIERTTYDGACLRTYYATVLGAREAFDRSVDAMRREAEVHLNPSSDDYSCIELVTPSGAVFALRVGGSVVYGPLSHGEG